MNTTTTLGHIFLCAALLALVPVGCGSDKNDTAPNGLDTDRSPGDTSVTPGDTNVIPGDTSVIPGDTSVIPGDTSVIPGDTSDTPNDTSVTPGDCAATPLASEEGFLWFSGYELGPANWDEEWGLEWKADENQDIVSNGVLFGDYAARVTYPAGSFSSPGGAQYRMNFANLNAPIPSSDELYSRYYVKFDENIDFVRGGKLPGFFGGDGNTGGNKPNGLDGWSARLMWLDNGRVVQYLYYPDQAGEYADDLDWNASGSSRFFVPGKWHCVETYIKMNTVDGVGEAAAKRDGIVRSWFDGELALDVTGVRFRYTNDFAIDGFYFSTFYGGGDAGWAPSKDEHIMFDNFVIHDAPIGCQDACILPPFPTPGPTAVEAAQVHLVYNGDDTAWTPSAWNAGEGNKTFADTRQNATEGGTKSAYIQFADGGWDAVVFTSPQAFNPSDYTHLRMRVMSAAPGVIFRVQMRGAANSDEATVDDSYTFKNAPWQLDTWRQVHIPIAKFNSVDGQTSVLIRANSDTTSAPFWVDDIELIVAK